MSPARLDRAQRVAATYGYGVTHKPTRKVRGWPVASAKPYQLTRDGCHLASFATLDALEINLRARAGC